MSGPIDRTAAIGMNAKSSKPRTFTECPTLYPATWIDLQKRLHIFVEDITGWRTINGMTAVGLIEMDNIPERSLWAVRCSCGRYEVRQYKDIRRKCRKGKPDFCDYCFKKWLDEHGPGATFDETFKAPNAK